MKEIEKIKPSGIFVNYIYKSIPLAFDESMSYYETLCGILELLKTQEKVVNNNADLLTELESYVNNYFSSLDIQEEINNKLDEMVQDGTLADIITQYVNLQSVLAFNTLNDLKNATNIINGSITRIIGKNTYNDGKGCYYKIRNILNTDVIDNDNIIAIINDNNLVGEKIIDENIININNKLQYGYSGNNELIYSDIDAFKNAIITDSYKQGNYLVYASIGGVIETVLVSKASNSYLTFIYISYQNQITQYHYITDTWTSEVYANNSQITSINNKLQYGYSGNNELRFNDIDDFKNAIITDTFSQGNYLIYASIGGVIETVLVSKASNSYLTFIYISYQNQITQYHYITDTWTSEVYANNSQITTINNKLQYGYSGNNELIYSNIDEFKNAIITDTFSQGNYLLYANVGGSINTIIISKASNIYLSFLIFGYDTVLTEYRYQNGTWYSNSIV